MILMSSDEPCSKLEDQRRALLAHWDEIPIVAVVEAPKNAFKGHPTRGAILAVLREGIEEDGAIRHALNPKEIKGLLEERKEIKMSQTNLYFHLNTLEEAGGISVVQRIPEGRHKVAYYGRVARIILPRDHEESLAYYRERFQELAKLAKAKHPGVDEDALERLPEEYLKVKKRRDALVTDWISKQDAILSREGIDGFLLYELINDIFSLEPENFRLLQRMADLIEADFSE